MNGWGGKEEKVGYGSFIKKFLDKTKFKASVPKMLTSVFDKNRKYCRKRRKLCGEGLIAFEDKLKQMVDAFQDIQKEK